ncbi:hypothetical protein H4R33_005427 [Dimargaris cristalligena]|uniref:Ran guanine nucleotide release factor n=2 Tax=Zoopagomycota TaxID=1913638 RepID=A0A4V1J5G8_9FUNG|nr:hypothetical protein H4R33_005427 [Dimargaris cristalligena]RKP23662.1 hypothetical protein SYNPS1DRAFT_18260 [Syncephalis pseudoplumigaleata]RKP39009.1 hypothetical protein BJ085DRAFT_36372 [Dimargaris cristalligena]|eukprot:RKP23662.1 hypothetical protein SYNPS1DRAFT_18260 [Syncephalis pseudoplumigaleata]
MASRYFEQRLFGGHIECEVPKEFENVSEYRPVPDHQEVFATDTNDQSIIFEIFDKADISDRESARYHFDELAVMNKASSKEIITDEPIPDESVPDLPSTAVCHMVAGTQMVSKYNESVDKAANCVLIYVAVIRLHEFHTDIVISMNHPMIISPESSSSKAMEADTNTKVSLASFKHILETFKIADFRLFGNPY